MSDTIHLAIISSEQYAAYAATTLISILKNLGKNRRCHIYVLTEDMSRQSQNKIKKLKKVHNFDIDFLYLKDSDFEFLQGINCPYYISRIAASRLLLPTLLPQLDKIVCVESDLIFRDDISKLYDIDLGNNYIGAVEDFARRVHAKDLWDNETDIYFNAGIMLVNLKKLRKINYIALLTSHIQQSGKRYKLQEQCLMNDAYKGHIRRLDIKWNFHHEYYPKALKDKIQFHPESPEEYEKAIKCPSVVHTPGADKFWHPHFKHPYKKEYMKLYRETSFYSVLKYMKYQIHDFDYKYITFFDIPLFSTSKNKSEKITKVKLLGITIKKKTPQKTKYLHGLLIKKNTLKYNKIYLMGIPVFYRKNKIDKTEKLIAELKDFIYQTMWLPQKVAELHQQVFPQFKNIHEGEDIVVVGCGPTLFHYIPIKGAKHISLNRAFRYKDIKFDYAFIWDLPGMEKANDGCVEDFLNYDCTKFAGKFLSDIMPIPEYIENKKGKLYRCYSSARHRFGPSSVDPDIHADISIFPLADFMSISFGALHFASWTHPKRIYLVGLDTTINGSFDGRQNPYYFNEMFMGYNLFKQFMQGHYPETEIISINPIGLKGIFHDVYTQSYINEHPEILKDNVEVLN